MQDYEISDQSSNLQFQFKKKKMEKGKKEEIQHDLCHIMKYP